MNSTENLTGRQPSSGEPGDGQDPAGLSRREVLGAAGAGAAAVMVPRWLKVPAQAATGTRGGHVHASWSEGEGSWDAQFHQATANAIDVLYMTDHDHRARALGFATSLKELPDYSQFSTDHDTLNRQLVAKIHAFGGIASYNHPFGTNDGPLLSGAEQIATRREVFASMNAVHVFGADILEVGYTLRGGVGAATHVDLWDTFSRNGTFLTGNGVNDDHGGRGWAQHANGFFTGIWAGSRADAALATALQAGRAFTAHVGRYPGAELDMLVDGAVPMGAVSVSSKTSRKLTICAAHVPGGATVQLIAGPVDYAGHADPGTTIDRSFPASAFVNGTVTVTVDTSTNRFYRIQVCHPAGRIIGIGNPVWLLRHAPPSGIPGPRR